MSESLYKNDELENEVNLDMSYFWYLYDARGVAWKIPRIWPLKVTKQITITSRATMDVSINIQQEVKDMEMGMYVDLVDK